MKCVHCIHERLIGKRPSVIHVLLRSVPLAVTVIDGEALCDNHLARRFMRIQEENQARQQQHLQAIQQKAEATAFLKGRLLSAPGPEPGVLHHMAGIDQPWPLCDTPHGGDHRPFDPTCCKWQTWPAEGRTVGCQTCLDLHATRMAALARPAGQLGFAPAREV